jgi:uroporphyrinogen-III synthase
MPRPTILLTRPAPDGATTAQALAEATGLRVVETPLIQIEPTGPLPALAGVAGLIFTSRNGPRAYSALGGPTRPAICVGDATAQAARDVGLPARAIGGDAERLIEGILDSQPDTPLMHLRGEVARGDVAKRLSAHGLPTSEAVIYRQILCDLNDEAIALLSGDAPVIVPLYSPRTASHLASMMDATAPLHMVAISPAVAEAAAGISAESCIIAETPDAPAMIRAVLATLRRVEGRDSAH